MLPLEFYEGNMFMRIMKYKDFIVLCILIIVIWVLSIVAVNLLLPKIINLTSWTDRGVFGDSFGGINALFSGLAFAGALYAIFLQRTDLEEQQKANEKQASEITEQTKAIAEQTKSIANELLEHEKQTRELARQIRLSIMPAFVVEVTKNRQIISQDQNWYLKMSNIGNGSATNITFENIIHIHKEPTIYAAKTTIEILPIPFMEAKKDPIFLEISGESYNAEGKVTAKPISPKTFTEIILKYEKDNFCTLKITFEDIEGTKYQQEIKIGYGVSSPGQVKEIKQISAIIPS